MAKPPLDDEAKFNETLKRLLKTPPKPHKESAKEADAKEKKSKRGKG